MSSHGIEGFHDAPLVPGMLTGFRSWKIRTTKAGISLQSVSYGTLWHPGVNKAECLQKNRRVFCGENHTHVSGCWREGPCDGVERNCGCGFWAYTTDSDSWANQYSNTYFMGSECVFVHGIIDGFGRCVVGPKGFRASSAIVRALVLPISAPTVKRSTEASDSLAAQYSTARIYPTVEAMRADNPLSTRDLIGDQ